MAVIITPEVIADIEERVTIVAGTFGGATKYVAGLLSVCGIPCGHEQLMHRGLLMPEKIGRAKAECSGDAARWVNVFRGARLIHLIRDPLVAANSLYSLRKGEVTEDDALGYILNFHKCMENRSPDLLWHIERDEDLHPVLEFFGISLSESELEYRKSIVGPNRHNRGQAEKIFWADLPPALKEFSLEHGYGEVVKCAN